jgi:glycosidase
VRQYTPEGTFNAFAKHLPRLKKMGVQTLWFMPINPIGILDRKGVLGSYYAVRNYKAINPEFGTMEDWNNLVKQCHKMGFKIIIDWVANHTAADHYWLKNHPNFYVLDSITHKAISPFDWTDARKLNYKNKELRDSMTADMEFWLNTSHIDGFRCDVASEVPEAFWTKCIATLRKGRSIFMLAEASMPWIHEAGFDATYTWPEFNVMKEIVKRNLKASSLDSIFSKIDIDFQSNALRLFFTSNHDENSWNKSDYGTMPGATHAPFAVLTQTMKRSVPLIYSSQEEPYLDSISFFYKNTIPFGKYARAGFYTKLLTLRKNNEALAANASYNKIKSTSDDKVFAYTRENNGAKVLVVLNLSKEAVTTTLSNTSLSGKATEVFSNKVEILSDGQTFVLNPWDYKVYSYLQ